MGDVAMIVPVLRCLKKQYPELSVTIVSKKIYKPIFASLQNIKFFEIDLKEKHKGLSGLLTLFKELRGLRPTHIADLHSVIRTHFLKLLFKIYFYKIKTIDKQRSARKQLFRKKNKILKPLTPIHYKYCEVLNNLGFNFSLSNKGLLDPLPIGAKTSEGLKNLDLDLKWIGIAPFASFQGKVYPLDLMQKIISFLQKEHYVFLFGNGEYEEDKLEVWSNAYENVFGTYKLVSLTSELEIISNLDLMISMDSANGHLAANYNVPVITLWGLTHPFAGFAPFLSNDKNMFLSDRERYPKIPTSAYGKKMSKGYDGVMKTIDCNEVISRSLEILKKS